MALLVGFIMGFILVRISTKMLIAVVNKKKEGTETETLTSSYILAAIIMLLGVAIMSDAVITWHTLENVSRVTFGFLR